MMPGGPAVKEVLAKVYTPEGDYITTWSDWTSVPTFRWPINGGPGALDFSLPRRWGASGEPNELGITRTYDEGEYDEGEYDSLSGTSLGDLMLDNIVRLYVVDTESENELIYQGRIAEYEHNLLDGIVSGTLLSFTSETVDRFVSERLQLIGDPRDIAEAIVNSYLPHITFDELSPQVGQSFPFIFERQKISQILDILAQAAGPEWYWRINPDNTLTFEPNDNFDPIRLTIGKEIAGNVRLIKSSLERKRRVIVYGHSSLVTNSDGTISSDQVVAIAADPDYDPDVNPLDLVVVNERIEDAATAQRIADALLRIHNSFSIETEITVADSNYQTIYGYDLESLRPGFRVSIFHPDNQYRFPRIGDHVIGDGHIIGGPWWAQVLQPAVIAEMEYHFTYAILKLTTQPNRIANELVGLADRLLLMETAT